MGKKTKFTTIKPFSRQILSALPSSVRNTTHTHCLMTSAKWIGHALLVYFICRLIKRRANQSGHVYFWMSPWFRDLVSLCQLLDHINGNNKYLQHVNSPSHARWLASSKKINKYYSTLCRRREKNCDLDFRQFSGILTKINIFILVSVWYILKWLFTSVWVKVVNNC